MKTMMIIDNNDGDDDDDDASGNIHDDHKNDTKMTRASKQLNC